MTWPVVGRRVPAKHRTSHLFPSTWLKAHGITVIFWYVGVFPIVQTSWVSGGVGGGALPPPNPRSACSSVTHASWCLLYVLICVSASACIPEAFHKVMTQLLEDKVRSAHAREHTHGIQILNSLERRGR